MVSEARTEEVEALLERVTRWAAEQRDVRALALVGSWAGGRPRADSDVDLVLLTELPSRYTRSHAWLDSIGGARLVRSRRRGRVSERRLALQSGLEVDVAVGSPTWAATAPIDAGTRRVAFAGLRALHDPDRLLAALVAAIRSGQ